MSRIEIRRAQSAKERMQFIKLPWQFNGNDPCWVPPLVEDMKEFLDPRKGPFFESGEAALLIAYRDGQPVGRISAQISRRHLDLYNDNKGFFGFFECEDNQETANALFEAAESFLREKGCTSMDGPYNFTIYEEIGVLIDGFDSTPYVMTVHNPPYYDRLLVGGGYDKLVDWYAFRTEAEQARNNWPTRLEKVRDRVMRQKNINLRPMDGSRYNEEADKVKEIFNQAWSGNFGHLPITDREWARIKKAFKMLVMPELSFFVEVDGEPVAFSLCARDANPLVRDIKGRLYPFGFIKFLTGLRKVSRFRMILMGVLAPYRNRGFEIAFYLATMQRALELDYKECEVSNIVETNQAMLKSLKHMPLDRYRTYRTYTKKL